jgi:hypothetical protein
VQASYFINDSVGGKEERDKDVERERNQELQTVPFNDISSRRRHL